MLRVLAIILMPFAFWFSATAQNGLLYNDDISHSVSIFSFDTSSKVAEDMLPASVYRGSETEPFFFEHADPTLSSSGLAYRLSWRQSHWQISFSNYDGEDRVERYIRKEGFPKYPRSYIKVAIPFLLTDTTSFYRAVLTAKSEHQAFRLAVRYFYDYDLFRVNSFAPSSRNFTLTAQAGYYVEFSSYRLTDTYYGVTGAFYAEGERRESRRFISPLVGAKLSYDINNLISLEGQIQLRNGALGSRRITNKAKSVDNNLIVIDDGSEQGRVGWAWDEINYDIDLSTRIGFVRIGYTQYLFTTHLNDSVMHGITASINF